MPKAICQICGYEFAAVNLNTLSFPLDGRMFLSPDPTHGVPDPIPPGTPWVDFRCPIGRTHRPIIRDNRIWTDEGMVIIPRDGSPAYIDWDMQNDIDRDSIIDRCTLISDNDAAKLARQALDERKAIDEQADRKDDTTTDKKPQQGAKEGRQDEMSWFCPICGKTFRTQQAGAAHIGKAHRKRK